MNLEVARDQNQASRKARKNSRRSKKGNHRRAPMEDTCLFEGSRPLDENLRKHVLGQDEAIDALVCCYSRLLAGLRDTARPLLTALLLGPTGVGKTETAKALAQTLFGSERSMTRVNCEEYAHGHELSKLLGSPPGYVGYNIEPLLSQRRIDEPHRRLMEKHESSGTEIGPVDEIFTLEDGAFQSVILFDEIEKAHPIVWNSLLGILEDGTLTLGDNSTTDFTRSIILMTSNVGSREMSKILEHRAVGFHGDKERSQPEPRSVRDTALAAARRVFPLEFLNRLDEILVYSPLERKHLESIFDKLLAEIHDRAVNQAGVPLLIKVSPEAKALIIDRGTDRRFGARPLRRAMEKELVDPLSRFIASNKLSAGDVVEVEREGEELSFFRSLQTSAAVVV
ncbi:MAG: AAA family ATPase [Acidobacteriota bacterium]